MKSVVRSVAVGEKRLKSTLEERPGSSPAEWVNIERAVRQGVMDTRKPSQDPARPNRPGRALSARRGKRYVRGLALLSLACFVNTWFFAPPTESEEVDPLADQIPRRIFYCGPGDGEPAALFRLVGEGLESGVLSVYLQDRYLYSVTLDALSGEGEHTAEGGDLEAGICEIGDFEDDGFEGIEVVIPERQVEQVLGHKLSDPDLPPVRVTVTLHNRLTLGFRDLISWKGYLQGCWLQFPRHAGDSYGEALGVGDSFGEFLEVGESPETSLGDNEELEPFLKPKVDISHTFGETMPIDLRLERNTVYYLVAASEDRDAVLLHPEDPELYSRARVLTGGTFIWRGDWKGDLLTADPEEADEQEASEQDGRKDKNLRRLKYTPTAQKVYLVLWALHRAADPSLAGEEGSQPETTEAGGTEGPDEPTRVNGWSRSAVYELTNGLPGEE